MLAIPCQGLPKGPRAAEEGPIYTDVFTCDPERTAFVLVDVWEHHHIPTHLERANEITRLKIVPALAAARGAWMRIVHAASGSTARGEPGCHRIHPLIEYRAGEYVHEDGPLRPWFSANGITCAVYVGFATNVCLLHKPYGVVRTSGDGYGVLVLRDAMTGIEYPDTLDGLWATRAALREIERHYGQTALTEDFIRAATR